MKERTLPTAVLTAILVAMVVVGSVSPAAAGEPKVHFWLTLMHNNDGESDLISLSSGPVLEDFGGAAGFRTVVDGVRWEAIRGPRPMDQR